MRGRTNEDGARPCKSGSLADRYRAENHKAKCAHSMKHPNSESVPPTTHCANKSADAENCPNQSGNDVEDAHDG